jgi:hypothetical protein
MGGDAFDLEGMQLSAERTGTGWIIIEPSQDAVPMG